MDRLTYNPCDECRRGVDRRDGSGSDAICKVCEFAKFRASGLTPDELAEAAALLRDKREGRCVVLPPEDYTFTIRGDLAISIIKANCRAAACGEAEP